VNEHWTGTDARRDALRLGWRHGLFCVGCCWALMLLMIPLGAGNLLWMLVLGAAMAIEKNVSWGRRLVKPLGFVLIATGLAIAARGLA
jgi:predicted metal-binding membrane protein